jgi:outer membrane lipoprotein SlyB
MDFSWRDFVLALLSGFVGAVCAQIIGNRAQQKMEIKRTKLDVLRKIAGNRAAVTNQPLAEQRARFFEGLNEVMIVFSGSRRGVTGSHRLQGCSKYPQQP